MMSPEILCFRCSRSFLYVFLGLASFVVWSQGGFAEQTGPLILYAVNLVLNLAWMPVSHSPCCPLKATSLRLWISVHGHHTHCALH